MKQSLIFTLCALIMFATSIAWASQAEVRDAAMNSNCKPKKIELYQQSLGASGEMVYQVTCDLPKTVGEKTEGATADALLISCVQSLCTVLRPVSTEKK
jgi:hypothetical protein